MEIVEIECPRSIDLLGVPSIRNKYKDAKNILQTIDIFDYLSIQKEIRKANGVIIISNDEISDEVKDKIKNIINIFSNYVGIPIRDVKINIRYDEIKCLKLENHFLAGLFIALNQLYKTNLTVRELVCLSERIDPVISFYLVGGYKKILDNDKNNNIENNLYNKYLLLDNFPYNDNNERERLNKFLNANNINYGINDCYFIVFEDVISRSIPISIKREFPTTILRTVNNASKNKVLVKYLK